MRTFRESVPSIRQAVTPSAVTEWRAARDRGLSLAEWRYARLSRLDLLPSLEPLRRGTVADIGANVGDWTHALLNVVPTAEIVAVEPNDAPRAELSRRFGTDPRVRIESRAAAASGGERDFYLTSHSHNASLNLPLPGVSDLYGYGWDATEITKVETMTLDDLMRGESLALLKIDVQGAESEVLAGATQTLARTQAILIEVVFTPHYENDVDFSWIHAFLSSRDFELVGLSEAKRSTRGTLLWADACYVQPTAMSPHSRGSEGRLDRT